MNKKPILALLIALFIVAASSFVLVMKKDIEGESENYENDNSTRDFQNTAGNGTNITLFELKTHNSREDCWISYKSKVYDVTSFLPEHPGSAATIIPYCGTAEEFEKAFTNQHGTAKVSMLEQVGNYKGRLV